MIHMVRENAITMIMIGTIGGTRTGEFCIVYKDVLTAFFLLFLAEVWIL